MTTIERLNEIQQSMSNARVCIAECEINYSELISDLNWENQELAREITELKDELRNLKEERD